MIEGVVMRSFFQPSDLSAATRKLRRLTRSDITRMHARIFIKFLRAEAMMQRDLHRSNNNGSEPEAYVVSFSDEQFSLACVNEGLRLLRRQKNCEWKTVRYDGMRGRIILSESDQYLTPEERESKSRVSGTELAVA